EAQLTIGPEEQGRELRRAAARAGGGPVIEALPLVGPDLERGDSRDVRGRAVFEMLVEEGHQHILPEPLAGVRAPVERAERRGRAILLAVIPWAEHELGVVAALDRREHRGRAVDVLLIPLAADDQGRDG